MIIIPSDGGAALFNNLEIFIIFLFRIVQKHTAAANRKGSIPIVFNKSTTVKPQAAVSEIKSVLFRWHKYVVCIIDQLEFSF